MRVRYRAARSIGGDFYAAIPLSGDRLLAALGDVSGKGIPAALTTAQITGELQALAHEADAGLAPYVNALNHALCQRLAAGRFAATTFLLYDPQRETTEVICAGQFAPWRWRNDTWEQVAVPSMLGLGIFKHQCYTATEFPTQPGEKWLLFSDGINEGRNRAGEEFGFERLRASLGLGCAADVLARSWAAWETFVDRDHQHDDACMALVLTKPPATLEITSCPSDCKHARRFIEDVGARRRLSATWSAAASCSPPTRRRPTSSGTPTTARPTSRFFSPPRSTAAGSTCACAITARR